MQVIEQLIKSGADIHRRTTKGYNAAMYAVYNNNLEFFKWLVEKGVQTNLRARDGQTIQSIAKQRYEENKIDDNMMNYLRSINIDV